MNTIAVDSITFFKDLVDKAIFILNDNPDKSLILDFTNVDYVSSSIIGAIISILNKITEMDGKVICINVSTDVRSQFELMSIPLDIIKE